MIGLIFHPRKLNRIVTGKEKFENIQYYYDLAEKKLINLFFYSLNRINFENHQVKGFLYSYKNKKLVEKTLNIPSINLFRTILRKKSYYNKLKELEQKESVYFINLIPRRNKYEIYNHLKSKEELSSYLPETVILSEDNLNKFIAAYEKILIKPNSGALGERIFVIEKEGDKFNINYTYNKKQFNKTVSNKHLSTFYNSQFKKPNSFLVQPLIPLKKHEGSIFDIRTSVQKNFKGEWQVTGIVSRVAGKDGIVTNVAQGGRSVSFDQVSKNFNKKIKTAVYKLSINVAESLESLYPATADLGMDIGIDTNDNIWFIEANFSDERYAYRNANNLDMWFASYKYPFEYAYSLYTNILESISIKNLNEKSDETNE